MKGFLLIIFKTDKKDSNPLKGVLYRLYLNDGFNVCLVYLLTQTCLNTMSFS